MVGEQYWQLVAFCGGGDQLGIVGVAAWGDQRASEVNVRLLSGGGGGVAWVGEVGAHGQGDAGAADIDQATITTRGTVNLLPFVQVLFQVEGVFTAGEADHRCNVGFAVGVVQWAACDHHYVVGYGSGSEGGKDCIVAGHGQLAE